MITWSVKSLLRERLALLGSATAVAAAFLLVMLFEAVWVGESDRVVAYIENAGADVWVMQEGVSNMHMATSLIEDYKADSVARVPGVAGVTPILYLNTLVHAGGRDFFAYVVGLRPDARRGGPWAMTAGRALPREGEVVMPDVMAELAGVPLGGRISIANLEFTVAGLSAGTFSMGNPVAFVHRSDLAEIFSSFGYESYVLVEAEPGVDPAALAERIEREVEKVSALPQAAFVDSDWHMAIQMGGELIRLMSGISATLAVLVLAFTLYTQTLHRRRELAIAKALGFRNRHIYGSLILQALILSGLGFALSYGGAHAVIALADTFAPQITMHLTPAILARVGIGGMIVGLVAALIPARRIATIDPQIVFQS